MSSSVTTRPAHRFVAVARDGRSTPGQRLVHLARREQWTFDLHEVHVRGQADASVQHRGLHGGSRCLDLREPADLFGREIRRVRDAQHQPLVPRPAVLRQPAPREHREVRREHALGSA
jgi:hypothetical protein